MSQLMQSMGGMRGMAQMGGTAADAAGQPEIGIPLQLMSMFMPKQQQQQPGQIAPAPARQGPQQPMGVPQMGGQMPMGNMGGMGGQTMGSGSMAGGLGGLPPQLLQMIMGMMGGGGGMR